MLIKDFNIHGRSRVGGNCDQITVSAGDLTSSLTFVNQNPLKGCISKIIESRSWGLVLLLLLLLLLYSHI